MCVERKKLCGEAVREVIKIFCEKGLSLEEGQKVLMVTDLHLRRVKGRAKIEDSSAEINTNFINCNF